MNNKDIKQESEREEFLGETTSNAVPDELEHIDQAARQEASVSYEDLSKEEKKGEGDEDDEDARRG